MFHAVHHVNGATLVGESASAVLAVARALRHGVDGRKPLCAVTVAAYGVVLLGASCAYYILTRALLATHAEDSLLAKALGKDFKGKISVVIYLAAIPLAFVQPWIACGLYVLVAAIWLFPDQRFEKLLAQEKA